VAELDSANIRVRGLFRPLDLGGISHLGFSFPSSLR
jgi:hypothetical protein